MLLLQYVLKELTCYSVTPEEQHAGVTKVFAFGDTPLTALKPCVSIQALFFEGGGGIIVLICSSYGCENVFFENVATNRIPQSILVAFSSRHLNLMFESCDPFWVAHFPPVANAGHWSCSTS